MQRLLGQVLSCPVLLSRLQSPSAVGALSTPDPKEESGREHQHQLLGEGTPGAHDRSCTCNHHPDEGLGHFQENLLVFLPSQYHPLHPCPQITTVLTSVTTHLFYLFLNFNLAQLCNILFCVCLPSPNIVSETRLNYTSISKQSYLGTK